MSMARLPMPELTLDLDGVAPAELRTDPHYYRPFGATRALFACRDPEVLLDGPKDTGKTRGALTYVLFCATRYSGMRALICRKSRTSLTQSVQVTFERKVLPPGSAIHLHNTRQEYQLPNGSVIVLGGLADNEGEMRIQSSEYDLIFVPEATELTEHELEMLTGLLRNGVMPYQQLVMDCNPSHPAHWLNRRCNRGQTTRLLSRHADNPSITPERLARLEALTGVRRKRLFEGQWAAAEGTVYDAWDPALHIVDRFDIPSHWRRWWAVDFGYQNPFVWLALAEDPDGRLFVYREVYQTRRLVEDHAVAIMAATEGEPRPREIVCDHDAEDRATLERKLALRTIPAFKSVRPGIDALAMRLRKAGDGRPRLFYLRDSLVDRDRNLTDPDDGPPRPASVVEEFDAYIWNTAKDAPVKEHDHGMDALRYLVARVDRIDLASSLGTPADPPVGPVNRTITGGMRRVEL